MNKKTKNNFNIFLTISDEKPDGPWGCRGSQGKFFFAHSTKMNFFPFFIFCPISVTYETKIKTNNLSYKPILIGHEKRDFWHICVLRIPLKPSYT
jgi:hypothetical protein